MHRRDLLKVLPITLVGSVLTPDLLMRAGALARPPLKMDNDQERILARLCDLIIPETDTPGAILTDVPAFIFAAKDGLFTPDERELFDQGIAKMTASNPDLLLKPFLELNDSERLNVVASMDENKESFFMLIKKWTLIGFFTSEQGMTLLLDYNPIPQTYEPCLEVDGSTKAAAQYF